MSKVEISQVKDENFGTCMRLTNGIVELLVTIDFGPRVISFSRVGMENVFFQDTKKAALGEPQEIYGGDVVKCYGGHRLWASPEVLPRCYYPDNFPVTCTEIENGMEFAAPVEKENNIQKIMRISLEEDNPSVQVEHVIKNCGVWEIELAPWCITQVASGAKEIIPIPNRETGLLMNRSLSFWDYTDMTDERVYWGKDYITLTQNPSIANPFKIGLNNEAGWGAVFNKGQLFIKFYSPVVDGLYPDNGCSYESYTNGEMLEVETLGEFVILSPEDSVTHIEEWELYEEKEVPTNDEKEIKALMSKYI